MNRIDGELNGWKERRNQLSASSLQSVLYFTVKMNFPQKVNGSFLALLCPWLKPSMLFYLPGIKSELQTMVQKFPNCRLQAAFESSGLAPPPRTHSASAIKAYSWVPWHAPSLFHVVSVFPTQHLHSRLSPSITLTPHPMLHLHSDPSLNRKKC